MRDAMRRLLLVQGCVPERHKIRISLSQCPHTGTTDFEIRKLVIRRTGRRQQQHRLFGAGQARIVQGIGKGLIECAAVGHRDIGG